MKKKLTLITFVLAMVLSIACVFAGCSDTNTTNKDISNTQEVVNNLVEHQPTPTDINYSLERYNLIRRAYWVNGQREKAMTLPCNIQKPFGYIVLFTGSGSVVGRFVVDGKVSSLNSYLTPNMKQDYVRDGGVKETELPDVDGSYGENVKGIFFFTIDGKYIEWTGDFLYSDIPFSVNDPILGVD